jgi:hypothetical protein
VADLSWLQGRGYATESALELVGNRYQLTSRQRLAVMRAACSEAALARRLSSQVVEPPPGSELLVDGYNVLTVLESALAGGVVLLARDGCCRDMASLHGTWRRVAETGPALLLAGEVLELLQVSRAVWFLDQPVSNSGRLAARILEAAAARGWDWQVRLELNPDPVLARSPGLVASADSWILDRCQSWLNLGALAIALRVPSAWMVDLRG